MSTNWKRARSRAPVLVALAVALACGLLSAASALAGGKKPPPEPPQPPEPPVGWEVIILHPIGQSGSAAYGISGGQQVGRVGNHAGLWNGTAESWVDLHSPDYDGSCASGIGDGQQVGYVYYWTYDYFYPYVYVHDWACLWTGTAQSYVNLHPLGSTCSYAHAASDGQQVGEVGFGGLLDPDFHASLWTGTAESWVDLNPLNAVDSCAYDVSDGQQVGVATVVIKQGRKRELSRGTHAGLWSGTAESWVDLHPYGYDGSEARGVSHGYQAGCAWTEGESGTVWHAGMWSGTAESWVDLSTLLPADYTNSSAEDIEVTSTDIRVVGYAYNSTSRQTHAVLWHKKLSAAPVAGAGVTAKASAGSPVDDPCPSDEEPDTDF